MRLGVVKDAEYASASDLRDALVKAGHECPQWDDKDVNAKFDGGACLTDDRDQLRVYSSVSDREADLDSIIAGAQLQMAFGKGRTELAVLVGTNWSFAGPVENVHAVKDEMGGYLPDLSELRIPGVNG